MKVEDIHTHIHAAWAIQKYGYKARRVKNKRGIYMLMSVEHYKKGSVSYTLMTPAAVVGLAKRLVATEGKVGIIRG